MLKLPRREEDNYYESLSPELRAIARDFHVQQVFQAIHMLESNDPEQIKNLLEANRKRVQELEQKSHEGLGARVIQNFKDKL